MLGTFMHSSKIRKLFCNDLELHFIFQELVLRDNKLTKIPVASIFKGLLVFDLSFNEISSLSGLANVSSTLKELYVSKNEVAKMEELEHFHALEILELGSNRLRVRNLE
jgi:protein phosphatase 1 regulatory subunit 7